MTVRRMWRALNISLGTLKSSDHGDGMMGTMKAHEKLVYLHHESYSACSKTMSRDIIGFGLGRGV